MTYVLRPFLAHWIFDFQKYPFMYFSYVQYLFENEQTLRYKNKIIINNIKFCYFDRFHEIIF